jgi:prolyl oligopeptidase
MSRAGIAYALVLVFVAVCSAVGAGEPPPAPATPKKPVSEEFHGTKVVDDYRWLENADDPAVRRWTEEQNRHTRLVLDQNPALPAIRQRVKELMSHASPDYFELEERGGKLFALKSQPPKNQPFLITLRSAEDPASEQVVLDPNQLNPKGTTAIDFYVPSLDGRLVAVSLSEGGSEEGTVHVYEVAGGRELSDVIPRVNGATAGGSLAWNADGSGFYYTRYPRGDERPKPDLNFYQQLYFHKLGTPTAEDTYCLGKDLPRIAEISLTTSDDGRYLLATVANGDGGEFAHYLRDPEGKWTQLTQFRDQVSGMTFGPDHALYLFALKGAPRGKILRLDLATPELSRATTVVPESEAAIEGERIAATGHAVNFVPTATRLYVIDQVGGPSQIRVFDHRGKQLQTVPLRPISSVSQPLRLGADGLLFRAETYLEPPAWYRFDPASGMTTRTALFKTAPVDFHDAEVVREFATSRDGTKVPVNILRRRGTKLDGRNPTLLTGYGGFSSSQKPAFSSLRHLWLAQGGVWAIANLRGGSEYGEEWHKAGSLTHKQNVFDDFAACAEHLIARKYTSRDRLAIQGGSNGGLLVGAALVQRPDLFRAVVGQVGIYDMLLHDRHPNGAFNVPEYGTAKDPEQFRAIYAYSPYQHVTDGTAYPAVFLLTGANDGRVDPANSRKMAARLQAATSSHLPVLLRVSSTSGHGFGTGLSEAIKQQADVFGFLFQQLGVDYRPAASQGPPRRDRPTGAAGRVG